MYTILCYRTVSDNSCENISSVQFENLLDCQSKGNNKTNEGKIIKEGKYFNFTIYFSFNIILENIVVVQFEEKVGNESNNYASTSTNKTKVDGKHCFGFKICSFILIIPLM